MASQMDTLPEDCARYVWAKVFNACVKELDTKNNGTVSAFTHHLHINRVANFLKSLRPQYAMVIDLALDKARIPYTVFWEMTEDHLLKPLFKQMFPNRTRSNAWEAYCFYYDAIHDEQSMFNIPHTKHWNFVYC